MSIKTKVMYLSIFSNCLYIHTRMNPLSSDPYENLLLSPHHLHSSFQKLKMNKSASKKFDINCLVIFHPILVFVVIGRHGQSHCNIFSLIKSSCMQILLMKHILFGKKNVTQKMVLMQLIHQRCPQCPQFSIV